MTLTLSEGSLLMETRCVSSSSSALVQSEVEDFIDRFADAMNGAQQWLAITPIVESDGEVEIVIDMHGHFAAHAHEATPLALCAALAAVFDSLATESRRGSESVLGELRLATR